MSQIKGKNTKPEMLVRKILFANGTTLFIIDYLGKPDFNFAKRLKRFRKFDKIRRYGEKYWFRICNTVEFPGIWESVYNAGFNYGEFATIGSQESHNDLN